MTFSRSECCMNSCDPFIARRSGLRNIDLDRSSYLARYYVLQLFRVNCVRR